MGKHTEPDEASRTADEAGATGDHSADRPATEEEATAADEQYARGDAVRRSDVARHEEEMLKLGAETKGEGAVE